MLELFEVLKRDCEMTGEGSDLDEEAIACYLPQKFVVLGMGATNYTLFYSYTKIMPLAIKRICWQKFACSKKERKVCLDALPEV